MPRNVRENLRGKLNGSVVWFSITTFSDGSQRVRGPYFRKPSINNRLKSITVFETYVLTQVDPSIINK